MPTYLQTHVTPDFSNQNKPTMLPNVLIYIPVPPRNKNKKAILAWVQDPMAPVWLKIRVDKNENQLFQWGIIFDPSGKWMLDNQTMLFFKTGSDALCHISNEVLLYIILI